ncbi:hypothetical protein K1719_045536 [Acacia pycnantha]|nr:hypothetical protein K1719_045536 [Acacia pycnantha]
MPLEVSVPKLKIKLCSNILNQLGLFFSMSTKSCGISFQPGLDPGKIVSASQAGDIQFLDVRNQTNAYLTIDAHRGSLTALSLKTSYISEKPIQKNMGRTVMTEVKLMQKLVLRNMIFRMGETHGDHQIFFGPIEEPDLDPVQI